MENKTVLMRLIEELNAEMNKLPMANDKSINGIKAGMFTAIKNAMKLLPAERQQMEDYGKWVNEKDFSESGIEDYGGWGNMLSDYFTQYKQDEK